MVKILPRIELKKPKSIKTVPKIVAIGTVHNVSMFTSGLIILTVPKLNDINGQTKTWAESVAPKSSNRTDLLNFDKKLEKKLPYKIKPSVAVKLN